MTENKRFINDIDDGQLIDTKGELSTIDYSDTVDFYELWEFLNKLNDENEQLKYQNELLSDDLEQIRNKKERYKRLSEIRQQQINNRILTIKEFINNCSDNKVRSVLKELFYSEVNEYDLSSENRKLLNENEQLKEDNMLLIEDSEKYRKLSIQFDNRNKELISENKQLKSELAEIKRQEQEVIEYLQAYHNGDVNELKKELKMND